MEGRTGSGAVLETLVVSVGSVTLRPTDEGSDPAALDAGGTAVDLVDVEGDTSEPVLDGAPAPVGTYDRVTVDAAVESARLIGGGSVTVEAGTLEQELVIDGEPAELTSRYDAELTLFPALSGDGPYELAVRGWGGIGL